ncbi:uncharacterized protein Tco025E_02790 [Trypanosoma conorhini]|uniref:Uncharacterized protein n=1 Tax=Trypanosoma conorhini TaxID=83891 RepID=A0A3R7N0Q0_9TRYP|nr:uncharacterized protein Tco025E_02790 [Trypanosoma conorhini]RNF23498.1 hypothetical protein Tco025E_02790 [Trypanosoma conorhini]
MGLAPLRRLLDAEDGEDAPLWFISAPADLQPRNTATANGTPPSAPPPGFPPPVHCQLRLVPLIKRYFPSCDSVLFQQLLEARGRQHLRYHFHSTQHLPPVAYLDPTMQYFDLELGTREVRGPQEAGGHEEPTPARSGPFVAPDTLYKLLVETTEGNLFEDDSAFNAALLAGLEGGRGSAPNGAAGAGVGNDGHSDSGCEETAQRQARRVRPVPCAILQLRYHTSATEVPGKRFLSFGLAKALWEAAAAPRKEDAKASVVVDAEGKSWLAWDVNGVKLSARVCGFYGCWTVDELVGHAQGGGVVAPPSPLPPASVGPFGIRGDSLVVSGCVERDVGERELPHAWMAACRAFASTMMTLAPCFQSGEGPPAQYHGDGFGERLPSSPHSLLRQLDLAFVLQLSDIPQLQLCRQVHLFMDALEELAQEPPTVANLHLLQRRRNCQTVQEKLLGPVAPQSTGCDFALPAPNVSVATGHRVCAPPPPPPPPTLLVGGAYPGPASVAEPRTAANGCRPSPRGTPPEKGVCSYFSDGAVVLRLSNAKVVEALQRLWYVPLSDTTEALMVSLTSRVPPPLVYRGELRPPNPHPRRGPAVPGVVARSEPEASAGLLLPCGLASAHDVFSVGREFDGAPFSMLVSPAGNQAPARDGGCAGPPDQSGGGRTPKNGPPAPALKVPDAAVAFGDLIRCDPVAGLWCVDSALRAEDVALSWMRRVTGKAREAKDLDARWLHYPAPAKPDAAGSGGAAWENAPDAGGGFVRLGRFRPWQIKQDGYTHFHCIAVRGSGAGDAASAALPGRQPGGSKKSRASPATRPTPKATAASQKAASGAVANNPAEAASRPGPGNQFADGDRLPPATPFAPNVPVETNRAAGMAGGPAFSATCGHGCGDGGKAPSLADASVVDGVRPPVMEQALNSYATSVSASPNAFQEQSQSRVNRPCMYWGQGNCSPCVESAGWDREDSAPSSRISMHSHNESLPAPKVGYFPGNATAAFAQATPRRPLAPLCGKPPLFTNLSTSSFTTSRASPNSQLSPVTANPGPASFSVARAPVMDSACAPSDDGRVFLGGPEGSMPLGAGGRSRYRGGARAVVSPPPPEYVQWVAGAGPANAEARTARRVATRESSASQSQGDEEDGGEPLRQYAQQTPSWRSSQSPLSSHPSSVRVYKEDKQCYHWNPYGPV